jgi:hypothetical protein
MCDYICTLRYLEIITFQFKHIQTSIYRGFPIATFDYRRVHFLDDNMII